MKLIPTILCGGAGSRLWPVSRELHPKPFIRLADGQSLLQKAWLRGAMLPDVAETLTVTNRELFFKTEDEYREVAVIPGNQDLANRFINIGSGEDLTIRELVEKVAEVVGYQGDFMQDTTKPHGTMRKIMDVSKIRSLDGCQKLICLGYNNGLRRLFKQE